ncbi:hypothetical protein P7C71_g5244, partial [Lecanoromycetidae sp. Uapishka_2]
MSQTEIHNASIDGQEHEEVQKKVKSRRPANTAFRQQRLKAWQPILTPKTVLPLFFIVGIIFAPIGGLLLYASAQVQEITIDYSQCTTELQNGTVSSPYQPIPSKYTSSSFKGSNANCSTESKYMWKTYPTQRNYSSGTAPVDTLVCSLQFNIPDNLKPPVLLYYRLTNFYQNHRRNAQNITYNMTQDGTAWSSDAALYGKTKYDLSAIAVPPNWYLRYQNGYSAENPPPELDTDYPFQVWMRTAGLPNFSKLFKRNDNETMECSMYQVDIDSSMSNSLTTRKYL